MGLLTSIQRLKRRADSQAEPMLETIFSVATLGLIALTGWAAYFSIAKDGWSGEAASWVQACGAIIAIAGAAWISRSESRRAQRQRRDDALQAAWYVRFSLVQAQFESQIVALELSKRTKEVEPNEIRQWLLRARVAGKSIDALVGGANHIHPSVVHVAANATLLIEALIVDLTELAATPSGQMMDMDVRDSIVGAHFAFLELIELYDERMRGVLLAYDEGDRIPASEWRSPPTP